MRGNVQRLGGGEPISEVGGGGWGGLTSLPHTALSIGHKPYNHPEGRSRRQKGEGTAGENGCRHLTGYLSIPRSGWTDHGFGNGQICFCVSYSLFSPLRNLEPEVDELQVGKQ